MLCNKEYFCCLIRPNTAREKIIKITIDRLAGNHQQMIKHIPQFCNKTYFDFFLQFFFEMETIQPHSITQTMPKKTFQSKHMYNIRSISRIRKNCFSQNAGCYSRIHCEGKYINDFFGIRA